MQKDDYFTLSYSGDIIGEYQSYDSAIKAAWTMFGSDGCWTITRTDDELETVKE